MAYYKCSCILPKNIQDIFSLHTFDIFKFFNRLTLKNLDLMIVGSFIHNHWANITVAKKNSGFLNFIQKKKFCNDVNTSFYNSKACE